MGNYHKILDTALNIIAPGSRFTISKIIEDAVTDVLINHYGSEWEEHEELFWNCYDYLRKHFKKEAYIGDIPYFYSMYYMLLNIPKIQMVLIQLMRKKPMNKTLKVLDIGCGVGTTAIALVDLFSLLDNLCGLFSQEDLFDNITIDSLEESAANIAVFNENISYFKARLNEFCRNDKFKIHIPQQADITTYPIEGCYDLIILSNVINEITYETRKNILIGLEEHLSPKGDIIIIEPASKKAAMELNRLKKEIVGVTNLNCIAPCGVCESCSQCWTFQTSDVCRSRLVEYIDRLYERKEQSKFNDYHNNRLKWGYIILSKDSIPDSCTNLSEVYAKSGNIVNVNIIGNTKNGYIVCDGKNNKAFIVDTGNELGYFHYGDFISFKNVRVKKNEIYEIHYYPESSAHVHHTSESNEKLVFPGVKGENLRYLLKRLWGFDDFREGQIEIIQRALQGDDILGILPTGAGKSICYQLPAMLGNGVSLIVSPLKSLIKDQITNLTSIGFEFVDYIDSSKNAAEKKVTLNRFKSGGIKLLYITPERLQMRDFQIELKRLLRNIPIDYFIIDEAHCASEWGHDFRPSYLKLRDIVTALGSASIIAVTATASPRVREDILNIFKIKKENIVSSHSLDRPEISFQVVMLPNTEDKDEYLKRLFEKDLPDIFRENSIHDIHNEGAGIIFTIYANPKGESTKPYGTEHILQIAKKSQIKSELYHSQLVDSKRDLIQEGFKRSEFPLLVSTKGFGMGIDKANIRYTVHMCYSNSLEAYYQEAGRAGRDREHAHSVIIARSRMPKCREKTRDGFEPPCVVRWHCLYTGGIRCDYGMQAKFISDAYPDVDKSRASLHEFYNLLVREAGKKDVFTIKVPMKKTITYQTYLYYFQMKEIILNYATARYVGNNMEFLVRANPNKFDRMDRMEIEKVITEIVKRLQSFKKQKYNMLESMWEYVSNTTKCRRQMLMDYLNDNVSYGEQGCRFCDIDGISEERSIAVRTSMKIKRMFDEYQALMQSEQFDYEQTKLMLKKMYEENQHESAKIRAMKHLEDYTESPVALYFRSLISLKRNKRDAYALNQAVSLVNLLIDRGEALAAGRVVSDLKDIEEDIANQTLASSNIQDIKTYTQMMSNVKTNASGEIIGKVFLMNKVADLNKLLARRI